MMDEETMKRLKVKTESIDSVVSGVIDYIEGEINDSEWSKRVRKLIQIREPYRRYFEELRHRARPTQVQGPSPEFQHRQILHARPTYWVTTLDFLKRAISEEEYLKILCTPAKAEAIVLGFSPG